MSLTFSSTRLKWAGVGLAVLAFLLLNSAFIVRQTEQAIVVQLGVPVAIVQTPGLKFKVPFIQRVRYFERRVLEYNAQPIEVQAADNKRLVVDAYVRYRITDPLSFLLRAQGSVPRMNERLKSTLDSQLRDAVQKEPLNAVISTARPKIMQDIKDTLNRQMAQAVEPVAALPGVPEEVSVATESGDKIQAESRGYGIEIVDVRLVRADLPKQNSEAIFARMRTSFEREAKDLRARGEEDALKIRAAADKERTILLAEAEKQAQTVRGEGDAKASKIFADSFAQDPDFYAFYRSLQTYRTVFSDKDTTMILSPNSPFLKEFNEAGSNSASGGR